MAGLSDSTKAAFRSTVNGLRERLLVDLLEAVERRYSPGIRDRSKIRLSALDAERWRELEAWLASPERPHKDRDANLRILVKERAYTLVNRLVILFQLEARGLRQIKLVSRGVEGSEFGRYTEFFQALVRDEDRGWSYVLDQVWDQLSGELPALFARHEHLEWIPLSGPTLLWAIDQLAAPELSGAWTDDTTLGWLYQYWNDPDRKAVDEKLNTTTGKVEAHELAAKTQLFTERYMVEWLVQNSLGAQWLALCARKGQTPKARAILDGLAIKRKETRAGEVRPRRHGDTEEEQREKINITIEMDEEFWKYYVDQLPAVSPLAGPERLADIKILDPAMGSGHFLVYVFDFLFELYRDEAALEGVPFSAEAATASILEHNLHGIDIDNRAVQIGAAALYLKAREKAPGYRPRRLNLVATDLGLGSLKSDDPGLAAFYRGLERETGIQEHTAKLIIENLKGADHLGSLLDVGKTIRYATDYFAREGAGEGDVLRSLAAFMRRHDSGTDLGLGHLADQLDKGLRLIALLGQKYDVIVANPPYLGMGKVEPKLSEALSKFDPAASGDLFALFMSLADKLRKPHGYSAFINMHAWMYLSSYQEFRERFLSRNALHVMAHLGRGGGFTDWADFDKVMQTTMFVWQNKQRTGNFGWYCRLNSYTNFQKSRQLLKPAQSRSYRFAQERFAEIPGSPMIYWWPEEFRESYIKSKKLSEIGSVKQGLATADNNRFLRSIWEVLFNKIFISKSFVVQYEPQKAWAPYVKGAEGKRWFESPSFVLNVKGDRKEKYIDYKTNGSGGNENPFKQFYEIQGLSFSYIGTNGFLCRLRKYKSIFDVSGSSIFCDDPEKMQVLLSSSISGYVSQSINPTINNQVGDIENLPVLDLLTDHTVYLSRARALYDRLFGSTETNIEYRYEQADPEAFEVEEARIRDEIDKEIFAHFKPATVAAIYDELGQSPFDYPVWDGSSIPEDFAQAYQDSDSILSLSQRYRLHPDGVLAIVRHQGLEHQSRRADRAFQHVSWALGVLLGRFDLATGGLRELAGGDGPGIEAESPETAARPARTWSAEPGDAAGTDAAGPQSPANPDNPDGLLYLSALDDVDSLRSRQESLPPNAGRRCLAGLRDILAAKWGAERGAALWAEAGAVLAGGDDEAAMGRWLREEAFARHLALYENRPIYVPLCSAKKSFLVWVNIHRWADGTLQAALARYLRPDLSLLEARIRRLREDVARSGAARERNELEAEVSALDKLREELADFVALVATVAERGPEPGVQEVEAPFVMDLDDGVMVNAGALRVLVRPLWKKPLEWWKSLSEPAGKKDFDWSHLAMRYWPARVMAKVKKDPSLAVAHSDYGAFAGRDLFAELHPDAARKWREQEAARAAGSSSVSGSGKRGRKAGVTESVIGKGDTGGGAVAKRGRGRPRKDVEGPGLFGEDGF